MIQPTAFSGSNLANRLFFGSTLLTITPNPPIGPLGEALIQNSQLALATVGLQDVFYRTDLSWSPFWQDALPRLCPIGDEECLDIMNFFIFENGVWPPENLFLD